MAPQPIGESAMTPAERQRRRRSRMKAEREAAARLAQAEFRAACRSPAVDRCRHNVGTAVTYLAGLGDPTTLARMLAESGGPLPPYPTLKAAALWLDRFASATLYAGSLSGDQTRGV
jgi:hypothetical protein